MTEDEVRLRHLADVQSTIVRLSQHSFVIRGWSVTLVSVLISIFGSQRLPSWTLALVAFAPIVIFWGLDAYYLRQERLFRRLYAAAARSLTRNPEALDVTPFDMDVTPYVSDVRGFVATLFTGHVFAIPAMLAALTILYALAAA